jgi:nucleotide-binding universal stress UspA family protein
VKPNRRIRRTVRRILHPSDFSAASTPAFHKAVEAAKAFHADLLVVHVPTAFPVSPGGEMTAETWDVLLRSQREVAEERLARLVKKARAAGVPVSGVVMDVGVTHEQIVRMARRRRIGLIVMGTHGRTGLTRALLGSVAARVIATAPCPVMTVHASSRRPPLALAPGA